MYGQGTYFYSEGDRYVGDWKDNNKTGQGTYYYPNGDRYIGKWKVKYFNLECEWC